MGHFGDNPSPEEWAAIKLRQRALFVISQHQHGCWMIINQSVPWWKLFSRREKEMWACVQVPDPYAENGMCEVYISPDGRMGVGKRYEDAPLTTLCAYIREEVPRRGWRIDEAYRRIIETLPHLVEPEVIRLQDSR